MSSELFLSDAAARLRTSVVAIVDQSRRRGGHGAGIAWSDDDLFVTSAHVVTMKRAIIVTSDGRAVKGTVVARDAGRDLAVLHAPGAALPPASVGDPYALRPGALVFAVGHPLGIREAVSVGMLQAVGAVPDGYGLNGKGSLPWVQADVRLAPGNSGGPIADVNGNVIGVAAMIVSGLALAIPAPDVEGLLAKVE
ncbi:MAG TPA: serine protease [Gemmatimonadales bacterium]|nr:serine protease [Gemmatimonadales bacterium]